MSHPGAKSSVSLIGSRYSWPDLKKVIKSWVRECLNCQKYKVTKHNHIVVKHSIYQFHDRFQVVHLDIVGRHPPFKPLNSLHTA
jgi:hypothetical protein